MRVSLTENHFLKHFVSASCCQRMRGCHSVAFRRYSSKFRAAYSLAQSGGLCTVSKHYIGLKWSRSVRRWSNMEVFKGKKAKQNKRVRLPPSVHTWTISGKPVHKADMSLARLPTLNHCDFQRNTDEKYAWRRRRKPEPEG